MLLWWQSLHLDWIAVSIGPVVAVLLPFSAFAGLSYDGTAFAAELSAGVRGFHDRLGRAVALLIIVVPVTVIVQLIVGAVAGLLDELPALFGLCWALAWSRSEWSACHRRASWCRWRGHGATRSRRSPVRQPCRSVRGVPGGDRDDQCSPFPSLRRGSPLLPTAARCSAGSLSSWDWWWAVESCWAEWCWAAACSTHPGPLCSRGCASFAD